MNAPASGGVVANEVVANVSGTGTVCIYTSVGTHVAADVTGYAPPRVTTRPWSRPACSTAVTAR